MTTLVHCAGTLLTLLALASSAAAHEPTASVPVLPYHATDQTMGTVNCANSLCHGSVTPLKESAVLQNEYVTWSRLDKHARAYTVLSNDRSRRIAKNLGMSQAPVDAPLCLDCHADNVPKAQRNPRFAIADGVTCEACHGPAGRYITTHNEPGATHAANLRNGLYPVDEAIPRARLCLSCHFGNQDKLVTHRLMGAGHPRLSFEIETFSMIEPAHFQVAHGATGSAADRATWDGVRFWAVGQALAVSQTMSILNDPKRGHDGIFPELVLFDCYGCHHPMSDARWKPRVGFGGSVGPGVARLNDSNLLMLRVLARRLDPKAGTEVSDAATRLHEAAAGKGDVHAEATNMQRLAEVIAQRANEHLFSAEDLRALALGVVDDGLNGDYNDYASAEQAVLSIQSIVDFENRRGLIRAPAAVNTSLGRLRETLREDEHYQPTAFKARLQDLRTLL